MLSIIITYLNFCDPLFLNIMNNWKTDFKVKFHLEYHHNDGTKEIDYNSLIVHAENEDAAKKTAQHSLRDDQAWTASWILAKKHNATFECCLLYTSPSPRD